MPPAARTAFLKIHLFLGLTAAIFLVILGLTGSVMAFEGDIEHWLHPGLWYVTAGASTLPEADLIGIVERQFAPARVAAVQFSQRRNLAQVMQLSDRSTVRLNPYNGAILDRLNGPTRIQKTLGYIHQIHLRLAIDPRASTGAAGKLIVSCAGLILCLLVPTGLVLWWRTKMISIRSIGSWFRFCFDAHQVVGFYASVFLWVAAFTGVMIGFDFAEKAIYALTHSSGPSRPRPPESTPTAGLSSISVDQAMAVARRTMPTATIDGVMLPLNAKAAFLAMMRVPEETSGIAHSSVAVDQYSAAVLQVHDFLTDSAGYRWVRFNRSIHTGDIWGLAGHILVSLSSLLLVGMVITGLVIWWKKLAI